MLELYHGATNNNIYQLSKGCDAVIQDSPGTARQYQQKQQHIKAKAAKAANINITHTPHDAFCTSVLLVEERWMAIHL